jgi:hypothetical protein
MSIAFVVIALIIAAVLFIMLSAICLTDRSAREDLFPRVLVSGIIFFCLYTWVWAYASTPWRYTPEETTRVFFNDIEGQKNVAKAGFDGGIVYLNKEFNRNFTAGEEVTLKRQIDGPYVGLYDKGRLVLVE